LLFSSPFAILLNCSHPSSRVFVFLLLILLPISPGRGKDWESNCVGFCCKLKQNRNKYFIPDIGQEWIVRKKIRKYKSINNWWYFPKYSSDFQIHVWFICDWGACPVPLMSLKSMTSDSLKAASDPLNQSIVTEEYHNTCIYFMYINQKNNEKYSCSPVLWSCKHRM